MTITIPDHTQYPPPANGFSNPYNDHANKNSVSATLTVETHVLSVAANVLYPDATTDTAITLVPPLRPFHSAAMHVVGRDFIDSFTGLTANQIRRFM